MSPERLKPSKDLRNYQKTVVKSADTYSMAIIICEALIGGQVWTKENLAWNDKNEKKLKIKKQKKI